MWMVTADVYSRGGAFSLAVFFIKTFFGEGQNALLTSPALGAERHGGICVGFLYREL